MANSRDKKEICMLSKRFAQAFFFVFMGTLAMPSLVRADAIAPSNCLPPAGPNDAYLGRVHEWLAGVVALSGPKHSGFTTCSPPPAVLGMTTTHHFGSIVEGDLFINGNPMGHVTAPAQTSVLVTLVNHSVFDPTCFTFGLTQCFDTEITQLNISGGNLPPGVMIRQDPDRRSFGSTSITDLGNGTFRIRSFFDVFTELSLDGGQTWIDSDGATLMTLTTIPEPSSVLLLGTGLAVFAALRLPRRNKGQRRTPLKKTVKKN
jgi:hypothetical protein